MKRHLCQFGFLMSACGVEGAAPDASVAEHDVSCVGSTVSQTPDPLVLTGILTDVSNTALPIFPIPNTEVRVVANADGAILATGMADTYGHFAMSVPSGGVPVMAHLAANPVGMAPARGFASFPLNVAFIEKAGLGAVQTSRLQDLATALGATVDASKGWLEVCIADCAIDDFADATIAVSGEAALQWAMLSGSGTWRAGQSTLYRPVGWVCSVAAALNLSTGPHTLTVTSGATTIGPVAFTIEAGVRASVFVIPGIPPHF